MLSSDSSACIHVNDAPPEMISRLQKRGSLNFAVSGVGSQAAPIPLGRRCHFVGEYFSGRHGILVRSDVVRCG